MKFANFLIGIFIILSASSCKKCYECTRKCGSCVKQGQNTLAGCDGESFLNGVSVDTWKVTLESQGYTCTYNNPPAQEVCSADGRKTYENQSYTCVAK